MLQNLVYAHQKENYSKFNPYIVEGMRNESISNYLIDIAYNVNGLSFIKFLGYDISTNEADIDYLHYKNNRKRSQGKVSEPIISKYMGETRCDVIKLYYRITHGEETVDLTHELYIPKIVQKYFYKINGKYLCPIYQIVDNSTYSKKDNLILKTASMPIYIEKTNTTIQDIDENAYPITIYNSHLFKKRCNIMLYYITALGIDQMIKYFGYTGIVEVGSNGEKNDNDLIFKVREDIFVRVNKRMFEEDEFLTAFVASIVDLIMSVSGDIYVPETWYTKLGSVFVENKNNQLSKGNSVMISFENILDVTNKKNLKLKPENKSDTYALIRWMIRNFNELKSKDNLDLTTKRIRVAEYVAYLYAETLNKKIFDVLNSMNQNTTAEGISRRLAVSRDLIMNKVQKSSLIRYDNAVNDLDFFMALKYSFKGPSGLGEKGSNAVPDIYRNIHPSHVGRLDMNSSGTSDPGMSGVLCPMMQLDGMYFDDSPEPDSWTDSHSKLIGEISELQHLLGTDIDENDIVKNAHVVTNKIKKAQDKLEKVIIQDMVDTESVEIVREGDDEEIEPVTFELGDDEETLEVEKVLLDLE